MRQRRAVVALAGSVVALGVLCLALTGAGSGGAELTALVSPSQRAVGAGQHQARCLDLPISSAEIDPSSCWDTGPTSILAAGTAPGGAGAGAVAVIDGQSQELTDIPDGGRLAVAEVNGTTACLRDGHGGYHAVDLASGQVDIAATTRCPYVSPRAGADSPAAGRTLAQSLAPSVTPSYYEYYQYIGDCGADASSGCPLYEQGQQTTPPGSDGIVVLDFGAPCSTPGAPAQYGVQLFESTSCTPDSTVQGLVQAWIEGYESSHGAGTPALTLAVGTSNSENAIDPAPYEPASLALAAQSWYGLVTASYALGSAPLVLWGASDMEQASSGWWDGTDTMTWVEDYSQAGGFAAGQQCAASQRGLLGDYGDDILGGTGSEDGWTAADVYGVAQGIPGACAVPEIYYASMATEWNALSQAYAPVPGTVGILFSGLMVEAVSGTLSANTAWTDLESDTAQSPPIPAITQIAPYGDYQVQGPPPQIATISPDVGLAAGGQTVTITGQGFSGATGLYFGTAAAASFTVDSATEISAVTPAGAGPTSVTVAGPTGDSAPSAGSTFDYLTSSAYTAISPARVLDTRPGSGQTGAGTRLGPGATYTLNLQGVDGLPSGATAAVLNVTGIASSVATYLTLYPGDGRLPTASNLNLGAGQTAANLVTVALGTSDAVNIYNHAGTVNVVADLEGWYAPSGAAAAGLYNPVAPVRVVDTRARSGEPDAGYPLLPGASLQVKVAGVGGIPSSGASAVAINVTAVDPTAAGYLTAYPTGSAAPLASNVNFTAGRTVPNRAIVPLGSGGEVSFYNHSGTTQLVVNVDGWFGSANAPSGDSFLSVPPVRITDTRADSGLPNQGAALTPEGSLVVQVAGVDGVPQMGQPDAPTAIVCNITAVGGSAASYLTAFPGGVRPVASDLNWRAGQTATNLALVQVSPSGSITLFNWAGRVDVVVDLEGWYTS